MKRAITTLVLAFGLGFSLVACDDDTVIIIDNSGRAAENGGYGDCETRAGRAEFEARTGKTCPQ